MNVMNTEDNCKTILNLFRLGTNQIRTGCMQCSCNPRKAICIGEDQSFLLATLLITNNLQWDIENGQIHIIDPEFRKVSLKCEKRSADPVLWNKELKEPDIASVDESRRAEEEEIKRYIQSRFGIFGQWDEICEPIVLALAVNSCYDIMDRDTLTHLCMNGECGAVLFRKVIMRILSLLAANWFETEKLEGIAMFLQNFLQKLTEYEYPPDLEQNIGSCIVCLCQRIRGSTIDMLYNKVKLQDRAGRIKWKKDEDILQYFADMEGKDRAYYASRLGLIQRILEARNVERKLWVPYSLVQLNGRTEETKYTERIRKIIDSISAQDEACQREAAERLGKMIDLCVMDWIDEEVAEVHDWFFCRERAAT